MKFLFRCWATVPFLFFAIVIGALFLLPAEKICAFLVRTAIDIIGPPDVARSSRLHNELFVRLYELRNEILRICNVCERRRREEGISPYCR